VFFINLTGKFAPKARKKIEMEILSRIWGQAGNFSRKSELEIFRLQEKKTISGLYPITRFWIVREVRGQVVFRVRDLPPSPDLVGPRVPEPRVPDLVSQAQKTVLKKHKAGPPRRGI